ncbi:hypothetical protein V1478_016801 [Vespula squamosa]|uniref:Uncharacterized protein n=1 Tax=Vespula squamosa TaxID=30214 RepID=A0ABD2A0U8_VESSQ
MERVADLGEGATSCSVTWKSTRMHEQLLLLLEGKEQKMVESWRKYHWRDTSTATTRKTKTA